MCGFIGQISYKERSLDLSAALPILSRRGPDAQRLWHSQDSIVSLLHARLAIVDQDQRAHQPMTNLIRQTTVALTGEIYNYEDLKREVLCNYLFKTTSDTEVVLAVYEMFGLSGFCLLKGMFSFALVDELKKKIFLVRDSVGKKPLFVALSGGRVLFGSQVRSLCAVMDKSLTLNDEAPGFFFDHGYINPTESIFREIVPVLPGEVWQFNWGGEVVQKTRLSPSPKVLYRGESGDEVAITTASLLELAVSRRLKNMPAPAVLFSGGVDSTAVTVALDKSLKNEKISERILAYSLKSLIPLTQDELFARYATKRLGLSCFFLNLPKNHLAGSLQEAINHQDEPMGAISYVLLYWLVKEVSKKSRVLLSGDGGDEVFLGYGETDRWIQSSQACVVEKPTLVLSPEPPAWMSSWGMRMISMDLIGHNFSKIDRASAEQGVEIRCPLLDWDLMAYVRSLPKEMIFGMPYRSKNLLKRKLVEWPAWYVNRKKLGFTYNLRWQWLMNNYEGCREMAGLEIDDCSLIPYLPERLRRKPKQWTSRDIFNHFVSVWKIIAWRSFWQNIKSTP